jgi:hypothetical protein
VKSGGHDGRESDSAEEEGEDIGQRLRLQATEGEQEEEEEQGM